MSAPFWYAGHGKRDILKMGVSAQNTKFAVYVDACFATVKCPRDYSQVS